MRRRRACASAARTRHTCKGKMGLGGWVQLGEYHITHDGENQRGWMDHGWILYGPEGKLGYQLDCKVTRFLTGDSWGCCCSSSGGSTLADVSCPLSTTRIGLSGVDEINPNDDGGLGLVVTGTSLALFPFCLSSKQRSRILCTLASISPTCFHMKKKKSFSLR